MCGIKTEWGYFLIPTTNGYYSFNMSYLSYPGGTGSYIMA